MAYEILMQNGNTIYYPAVEEGVKLTWERKGTPGELSFTVLADETLNIAEGNPVKLSVDGQGMFYGFLFKQSRDKDGRVDMTAYDQLRYLKNKDTYTEEGIKASALVKRIATDFNLQTGTIADTGYKLETVVEENQTLFDIIQNALDETLMHTKKLFVLYDDVGKLTLKNVNNMKVGLLVDAETAEDFSYESSIDDQTYNKIKLTHDNEKTGKRDIYVAQSSKNINAWGVLQYYETVQTATGAKDKANKLLELYNVPTRKLTVKGALGDVRVRAGCGIMVNLNLGDRTVDQMMVVDRVVHTFKDNDHRMDLDLVGGDFLA